MWITCLCRQRSGGGYGTARAGKPQEKCYYSAGGEGGEEREGLEDGRMKRITPKDSAKRRGEASGLL